MELLRPLPTTRTEHFLREACMAACRPAGPHPMMRTSVSILQPVDVLDDVFLGSESHEGIHEDLVLEHEECGDRVDVEPDGDSLVLIGVELCDACLSGEVSGELLDDGAHPPAGAAPGCPAVNDCNLVGLYEAVEVGLIELCNHISSLRRGYGSRP